MLLDLLYSIEVLVSYRPDVRINIFMYQGNYRIIKTTSISAKTKLQEECEIKKGQ